MESGSTTISTLLSGQAALYLGVGTSVILLTGALLLLRKMGRIRRECKETLAKRYSREEIICHDNGAHCYGMEKCDSKKVEGNGVLALTERELYFLRPHPQLEIIIPVKAIKRCLIANSFLNKQVQKQLLKIDYIDEKGVQNSVAWRINDLAGFEGHIQQQRKRLRRKKRK